jgi:hypothetical protein
MMNERTWTFELSPAIFDAEDIIEKMKSCRREGWEPSLIVLGGEYSYNPDSFFPKELQGSFLGVPFRREPHREDSAFMIVQQ